MEHLEIELENGVKLKALDTMELDNKKYFYIKNNDEFLVCLYNEVDNHFIKINDKDVYTIIEKRFINNLNKKTNDVAFLDTLSQNMIESIIIYVQDDIVTLQLSNKIIIKKNMLFYDIKPTIGSKIFMSNNIMKEVNIFQYGSIYDYNNINENEIIKIVKDEKEYYLQRYYG